MKIAVLSGKGGAGKTLVAANLAAAVGNATYIDCDVEEPNGRLFFKPENLHKTPVYTMIPKFDPQKCTGCRTCVRACRFHALIYIRDNPQVFTEVCHSCGLCQMVCPEQVITEVPRPVGYLEVGTHGGVTVVTGVLNPGEASGIAVIQDALSHKSDFCTVIDCPPGSACPVMESISDADYCILVAEPTAFGFHNFQMVHELTALLGKRVGVVINKLDTPYPPLEEYCKANGLPILLRIPYRIDYAHTCAEGKLLCEEDQEVLSQFRGLWKQLGGAG